MKIRLAGVLAAVLCSCGLAWPAGAQDTPQPQPAPAPEVAAPEVQEPQDTPRVRRSHRDIVTFGSNAYLGRDESAETLIAIGGSATSEGEIEESVVAVFGDSYASGTVADEVVAVFGDVYVDGAVGSEVVAVMGNVTIGPNAVIDGDVTSVGGVVTIDPAAKVNGDIEQVSSPLIGVQDWVQPWLKHALLLGRPLAFDPGVGWAWRFALFFLFVYVILGLAFPKQVGEMTRTFEQAPGESVLAGLLTLLLLPLIGLTLLVTVIGIGLLPFLWIGLFVGVLFGKAAVLATLGRGATRFITAGPFSHIAFAVFVGGLVVLAVYATPILGFIAFMVMGLLGLGVFVYAMLRRLRSRQMRRAAERGPPPPAVDLTKRDPIDPATQARAAAAPDDRMDASLMLGLPRAGFWLRMGALFVDLVLVAVVVNIALDEDLLLVALAAYGALMWKLKGTTIGGTLCNLQVVRLDARELDWATAIVRSLGCFLSLVVGGLGFLWIAFDGDRQAWHDKIAGTVVVRTVKTVALV